MNNIFDCSVAAFDLLQHLIGLNVFDDVEIHDNVIMGSWSALPDCVKIDIEQFKMYDISQVLAGKVFMRCKIGSRDRLISINKFKLEPYNLILRHIERNKNKICPQDLHLDAQTVIFSRYIKHDRPRYWPVGFKQPMQYMSIELNERKLRCCIKIINFETYDQDSHGDNYYFDTLLGDNRLIAFLKKDWRV
jgi:hypothetical protein